MRASIKYTGLVLLMVAARYAPIEQLGGGFSWFMKKPPSSIVTGSVASPAALTGPSVQAPAMTLAAEPKPSQIDQRVRTILAEAQSNPDGAQTSPSAGDQGRSSAPRRSGSGDPRGATRRSEAEIGEIQTGGTGLLDDTPVADPHANHPLVLAHPDDFVVLCEAGCRPLTDVIVYKVSKVAASAAAVAQRRLELTAAAPATVVASADNQIVCVAGCYDDEPASKSSGAKRAEQRPAADEQAMRMAVAEAAPVPAAEQAASAETIAAVSAILSGSARARSKPHPMWSFAALDKIPAASEAKDQTPAVPAATAEPHQAVPPQPQSGMQAVASAASHQNGEQNSKYMGRLPAVDSVKLADVHLISSETHGRHVSKRVKAVAHYSQHWRTTVTLFAEFKPLSATLKERLAMWKKAAIGPFQTTVSREEGWESALADMQ